MNDAADKELSMLDRYVHLDINTLFTNPSVLQSGPLSVTAKLIEDGVELEVWAGNECLAATYTSYAHMGIDVIDAAVFDNE